MKVVLKIIGHQNKPSMDQRGNRIYVCIGNKWGGDKIGLGFTLSLLDNGEEGRGQVSRDLLLF